MNMNLKKPVFGLFMTLPLFILLAEYINIREQGASVVDIIIAVICVCTFLVSALFFVRTPSGTTPRTERRADALEDKADDENES